MKRGTDQRGFTLIEIIVAFVIISMAAALVGPAIDAGLRQRDVRSAVRTIAGAVKTLQGDAIQTGKVQELILDPEDNALYVVGREDRLEFPDSVSFGRIEAGIMEPDGAGRVRFYPNGSTGGLSLIVGDPEAPIEDAFYVQVDPLIGSVTVGDIPQ